ncbi:MAG TPA: type II toxin-antitoxin system ParD family antitoxin [Kofleriaceae bacterium]|nr:type II toxin-antitoxin system ParD family antitoxin [Kofleriaceae bacterium]
MPIRNISLTRAQDAFIARLVETGEYPNASEVMRDALRALQKRRRENALRLAALRAQIQTGLRDLEAGNFVEVESDDLEQYLARLTPRRAHVKPKRAR